MPNETIERRVLTIGSEIRVEEGDGPPKIVGHAAVFNTLSEDLGGFRETIKRGAFKGSLADGADVRALINHNSDHVLGRISAGTLKVWEGANGLRVEIQPPDTQAANDLMTSIKRGDVTGMSFAFNTITDDWRTKDEESIRELKEVHLIEVSPVTFPAYPATDVALRSLKAWIDIHHEKFSTSTGVPISVLKAKQDLAEAE